MDSELLKTALGACGAVLLYGCFKRCRIERISRVKLSQRIPTEINESLSRFRADHPDPKTCAFIMMRFQRTGVHRRIIDAIRRALGLRSIDALRADDAQYHTDLYWNILTYIYGCGFGVAVFERIQEESFNPNIAYEVGYMLALGKPVCILKEETLKTLQTDLAGKLYRGFDVQHCKQSIRDSLQRWLADKDVGLPIEDAMAWIEKLDRRKGYRNWHFRINWPLSGTGPKVDAYSPMVTCRKLFQVLKSPELRITVEEFNSVLSAMKRATKNESPLRKLSGDILFAETSVGVLNGAQGLLGSTPYERPKERHEEWRDVLGEPEDIFPPSELFCMEKNIEKYKGAQKLTAKTASQICKSVLCSTYQISVSQALYWKNERDKNTLAMVCTARSTKKENVSPVSEVPTVMELVAGRLTWFGQPGKRPTTEYQSHWCFHRTLCDHREPEHILVHFHPVALLEAFDALQTRFQGSIPSECWNSATQLAEKSGIKLVVFVNYMQTGARDPKFGEFIAEATAERIKTHCPYTLVWKPDHGLWLTMCGGDIEKIRKALEQSEVLSVAIAAALTDGNPGILDK